MVDVYVVGSGIPELAAALEFAEVGLSVRVGIPESECSTGAAHGFRMSSPAPPMVLGGENRGVSDTHGSLASFFSHVSTPIRATSGQGAPHDGTGAPVRILPDPLLLRTAKGGWAIQPTPAVLGIPAVPLSAPALEVLGGGGATRAYLDKIKPVLTIGKTNGLGELVRARLGVGTLRLLTEPFVRHRFGVDPDAVEVAIAAPGLNEKLTQLGSLSGAVMALSEQSVARETLVAPAGGWAAFGEALVRRLGWYDVSFDERPVRSVRREAEKWTVEFEDGAVSARAITLGYGADHAAFPPERITAEALRDRVAASRTRAWVSFAIEEPAQLGQAVVRTGVPAGVLPVALCSVDVPGEGRWSIAFLRSDDGAWAAEVIGPATAADSRPPESFARTARLALESAGGTLLPLPARVSVRVAPYTSTGARAADSARLHAEREETPEVIAVGAGLHGDDLSAAVADARLAAVRLRRRLTGIAGA